MDVLSQAFDLNQITALVHDVRTPIVVVKHPTQVRFGVLADVDGVQETLAANSLITVAKLGATYPEYLGDPLFCATHKVRFPYIVGEMANGIATADMVIAANRAGLVGSFGAAGMMPDKIRENIKKIKAALGDDTHNWACNLIYMPNETDMERKVVELYLEEEIRHISSSAYMSLSPHIVRYAFSGVHTDPSGNIVRPNHVMAKLSHPSVAKHFLSPPPDNILSELVAQSWLTEQEAKLASQLPVAEDITAEADSGGHTDNRPLSVLFPILQQQSVQIYEKYNYPTPVRIGAAGGLGTPGALAAAFGMGAAYVLTGTVNEAAIESGVCDDARAMLAQADFDDVEMAPAADMFEMGVKLQVLKRGTMFARRAHKLYGFYKKYQSIEEIAPDEVAFLEKEIFRDNLANVWQQTETFFKERDPRQLELAAKDAKYKMALLFRAYLGQTSRWAMAGIEDRKVDYQLWCGPAMGSFNRWVKGTCLEEVSNRTVQQIAYNLLEGASTIMRAQQLRMMGVLMPAEAFTYTPQRLS